jgi:hypothetical protein
MHTVSRIWNYWILNLALRTVTTGIVRVFCIKVHSLLKKVPLQSTPPSLWRFDPIPCHGTPLRAFAITLRHTTFGSTPLSEWSARRRDLYLTTHNTHKRQNLMTPVGFEPTIPTSECHRFTPQIARSLDRRPSALQRKVAVYFKNHMKHTNTQCAPSVWCLAPNCCSTHSLGLRASLQFTAIKLRDCTVCGG